MISLCTPGPSGRTLRRWRLFVVYLSCLIRLLPSKPFRNVTLIAKGVGAITAVYDGGNRGSWRYEHLLVIPNK